MPVDLYALRKRAQALDEDAAKNLYMPQDPDTVTQAAPKESIWLKLKKAKKAIDQTVYDLTQKDIDNRLKSTPWATNLRRFGLQAQARKNQEQK